MPRWTIGCGAACGNACWCASVMSEPVKILVRSKPQGIAVARVRTFVEEGLLEQVLTLTYVRDNVSGPVWHQVCDEAVRDLLIRA